MSKAAPYTKLQPKHGDRVLTCAHTDKPCHFFKLPDVPFSRPDGSSCVAQWIAICGECFDRHPENPDRAVTSDAMWMGDEPAIKDDRQ